MLAKHFSNYFEVMFAHSDKYVDFIEKEGYRTFDCQSLNSEHVMNCAKKFDFSWINEASLEPLYLDQVRAISKLKPLAVLGDTSLTLKMAAEKCNVHFISLMNGYMTKYYLFTRKLSRTHPVYKYINILSAPLLDLITQKGEAISFLRLHRPFKKIRSKYLLSQKINYQDELEGDINLVCDLETLFPQKSLPSNYAIIPPLYYDTKTNFSQTADKIDKQKKTIFVTMGSTGDWKKLKFLNNPYFQKFNIITAGDDRNTLSASHIIKTDFINIHEIFNFTSLVICQGGNGTIYQALLYGIPLLCKTNNFEQEWNVEALERLNVGRSLDNVHKLTDSVILIEEWIIKKDTGVHQTLKLAMLDKVEKLGAVIEIIAIGLMKQLINDLQHF